MLLTGRVVWAVAGLAFGWGLLFVCYDLRNGASVLGLRAFETIRLKLVWPTLMRLGKLAFPLGFATLLISLNANIPRYFVQHELGVRELGIFGALSALLLIDRPMVLALGESASPRLAQQFASRNIRAFQTLLLRLIGLEALFGAGLFLMALLAGPRLLGLVYGPEYAAQSNLFVWLAASSVLGVWPFLWYGMTAARYFRVQAPLFLVVAIVTAIASAVLIPAYGLVGSAIAVMAGLLTQVVGSVAVLAFAVWKARSSAGATG
jgi:O-antigen/teichoic acid export membrane protein